MAQGSSQTDKQHEPRDSRFRAQLFGGRGDGLMIGLSRLEPTITVYRNGGPPFVVGETEGRAAPGEARLLGCYELVGPVGPETPVYISCPS